MAIGSSSSVSNRSSSSTSRSSAAASTSKSAASTKSSATLRVGSRGPEVSKLQDALRKAGFNPGKTDGVFGPKTQAAVRSFQQAKGLTVDGIAGKQTLGALRNADAFEPPTTPPTKPPATGPTGPITDIPKTGNAFIDRIAADAIKSQQQTGVPASVTMAQAILESGWGKSGLSTQANNFFGIKGTGPAGSVTMRTREVINGQSVYVNAAFRKYDSPAQSFADHGKFFTDNKRYSTAMKHTDDPHRFAQEIAKAGYATDPNYAKALSGLINQYGLGRFDKIARGQ
jgi:flagellum-specific peptidoglycan hydrolase FlgJ